MYVRDLENEEYVMQMSYLIEEELNGNCIFSANIPPNRPNLLFLSKLSEMWTLVDDNATEYKVVYLKKQGEGNTLTADIKAVPKFYDDFDSGRVYEEYNQSFTANACFATIFNGSGYFYQLNGSYSSLQWEGFGGGSTRLEMFKDALNRYGAEFKVLGQVVHIDQRIGSDLNVMYRHRLNASNIVQETDASGFWTYVKGYGDFTDEDGWQSAKLIREYTSPLASIPGIGKRHAPPLKDGRIKLTETMDSKLKSIADESLKISVTANIHDLTKQKYPIAQSGLGDRVFLIDERIGLNAEVRVVNRNVLRDWRGNILDIQLTFGSQDITKRYQSNLNNAAKTINDLMSGQEKLPLNAMAAEVANVTNMILNVTSEIDITSKGLIAIDKTNPNYVVILNSAGLGVSTDGGTSFKNAITGRGIVAERILAGEIKGSTLRTGTDSETNYVHIQRQFIRLMESNLTRVFIGYYTNSISQLQPTIILGGDTGFQDGSVVLSQQPTQGFLGTIKGKDTNGDPKFVSYLSLGKDGSVRLRSDAASTIDSATSINQYARGGLVYIEGETGVTINAKNNSFWIDAPQAIFKCHISANGVNVGAGAIDSSGTIKYMNGFGGWGYYGHIGAQGWAKFTITL